MRCIIVDVKWIGIIAAKIAGIRIIIRICDILRGPRSAASVAVPRLFNKIAKGSTKPIQDRNDHNACNNFPPGHVDMLIFRDYDDNNTNAAALNCEVTLCEIHCRSSDHWCDERVFKVNREHTNIPCD